MEKKIENEMETGVCRGLEGLGVSQKLGYRFGGPQNNENSILGVYTGVSRFWETTMYTFKSYKDMYTYSAFIVVCVAN